MADTLSTLVTLLTNNWTSGNTDSITPTISAIFSKKRVGGLDGIVTWVAVYSNAAYDEEVSDLNYTAVDILEHISFDIRTSQSRSHVLNCVAEVKRIIYANKTSISGFNLARFIRVKDLCDASRNLWRFVLDLDLNNYNESI